MISKDLAERLIQRITRYTEYNVNIMDENGVIIASRDREQVGKYHEVAHRLIVGNEDMIDTTGMAYPNVRPGINMIIEVDKKREGYGCFGYRVSSYGIIEVEQIGLPDLS